ncbi:MAG: glycine--tRNA ligase subunit beta [Pseudomonadota bacterium]
MTSLLLELYVEEIPAMMQKNAEKGFYTAFCSAFDAANITYSGLEVFIGPRRITLHVPDMAPSIPSKILELKGPKTNAPEAAINGFCQSNNISKDDLIVKVIKDQECYAYEKHIPEQNVIEILPPLLASAIFSYTWPKSMAWGAYDIKFVRPIKNILCIFGGNVLPFTYAHLTANNKTFGHRFMHYKEIEVSSFEDYREALVKHMVILSRDDRSEIIQKTLQTLITEGLTLSEDSKLLEEVVGLVEYPNVLMGKIPPKFMHVPSEILITAMRQHQRYFTLQNSDGSFAPYFLFAANIKTDDSSEIISGNEKVLSARLSDAEYFYKQDQKITLEERLPRLERIIFHAKLGSMRDKVERIEKIAQWLAPDDKELHLAARLCKSDLVTEVVGEFPELQGIMGGYYAKLDGLSNIASDAIKNHYKPEGMDDDTPTGNAALLALADKIDSLVSLYIAGERSSGSKDPYALRRYALSIIRIILSTNLNINIKALIEKAASLHDKGALCPTEEILAFIEDRLKHYMLKSYSHGMVQATINLAEEGDIVIATSKLSAINSFLETKEGVDLLICYTRASSILNTATFSEYEIKQNLFSTPEEGVLFDHLHSMSPKIDAMLLQKNFVGALELLAALLEPINKFFDNVTVMDDNKDLASNRLALLSTVTAEFHKLAKFGGI